MTHYGISRQHVHVLSVLAGGPVLEEGRLVRQSEARKQSEVVGHVGAFRGCNGTQLYRKDDVITALKGWMGKWTKGKCINHGARAVKGGSNDYISKQRVPCCS